MTPAPPLSEPLHSLTVATAPEHSTQELLRRGLDWLAAVAPYDLATVFKLEGEHLEIGAARGPLADSRLAHHSIRLADFPTVREALETRRARAFTEHDHAHGDGDPFDGVLDLPHGHSCMVVPLSAGSEVYGALTLDRTECEIYPEHVVDLVEVYGRLLALALQNHELRAEVARLGARRAAHARELERRLSGGDEGVLAESASAAVRRIAHQAEQVARTATPVLIQGETGTGKERLAHAIHDWSGRAEGPFVAVNCAAIPANLLESELFGHAKGAFTGATGTRTGRFRLAEGGTLFLDEIGELPLELQAKLLRAVQEGEVQPVGSDRPVSVDVRLLAATHVDLEEAVRDGRFREDLYYRLSVFPLYLPPLRERLEDLPALVEHLLGEQAKRTGQRDVRITDGCLALLRQHTWPGNIRELANVLERAVILSPDGVLDAEALMLRPSRLGREVALPVTAEDALRPLEEVERAHIARVLHHTAGKVYGDDGAATILGLKPSTLQSRMKKLGVDRRRAARGEYA